VTFCVPGTTCLLDGWSEVGWSVNASRRVTVGICAVGVAAAAGLTILLLFNVSSSAALGADGYKAALQFLSVVILGGALSLLYQAFNREADQRAKVRGELEEHRRALRQQRLTFTAGFVNDYNAVKKARRLLRARALDVASGTETVRLDAYDAMMNDVLEVQLRLETTRRALERGDPLFAASVTIISSVVQMDNYLRDLITEFEEGLPSFRASATPPSLDDFPELQRFLGPYRQSERFRTDFVKSFHAALSELQTAVTETIEE